jgi:lysyl-tRNA synthetase class II
VHLDLSAPYGNALVEVFEAVAEAQLIQPTFITGYPIEVSPLARKNDADPAMVDRFELELKVEVCRSLILSGGPSRL